MNSDEMKNKLSDYIDGVIQGNEDASKEALSACITAKAKAIVSGMLNATSEQTISEAILKEFTEDSPIKLKGNSVVVNGKIVGKIENDLNDPESGINFIDSAGNQSFEFSTIKELYQFLMKRYGVK